MSDRRRKQGPLQQVADLPERQKLRVLTGALAVLVTVSVLAIGSVHVTVFLGVAMLVFATWVLAAHWIESPAATEALRGPALVLVLLSAYSLLQAVPTPMTWLHVLSPKAADVWSRSLLPFGEPPPVRASLSLDPGGSLVEALKWLTYAGVFTVAAIVGARRGATAGVTIVFVSALITALVTVGHGLMGIHKVYGLYTPRYSAARWNVGPLLNPNNLAGYLNLGAVCGMGLLMASRPPLPRRYLAAAIALIVGTSVVSASRAGVLALPFGVVIFSRYRRKVQTRRSSGLGSYRWVIPATVAGGVVLAVLASHASTWKALADHSVEKLEMLVWAQALVRDYPWFGIGRGATSSVFSRYRGLPGHNIYGHVENFAAQWAVEWGLPVTIGALILLAWMLRPGRLGANKRTLSAAVFAAVVVVLLQNMVDLALEVPGVCIAVATVLGSVYGEARQKDARRDEMGGSTTDARPAWVSLLVLGTIGTVSLVGSLKWGLHRAVPEHDTIHGQYVSLNRKSPEDCAAFRAEVHEAMRRHPADAYFPLVEGLVVWRTGGDPLPWLQRAIERNPLSSRAHLLLAYVLANRKAKDQALLELRLAVESDPLLVGDVAKVATTWTQSYADLKRIVPDDPVVGAQLLARMSRLLLKPEQFQLRRQLVEDAIARAPDLPEPRIYDAKDLVGQLARGPDSQLCGGLRRSGCLSRIAEDLKCIQQADTESSAPVEIRAQLLLSAGRFKEAEDMLASECPRFVDRTNCYKIKFLAVVEADDVGSFSTASNDLMASACVQSGRCAAIAGYAGDLLLGHGYAQAATGLYRRAAREQSSPAAWVRVASAASRAGEHAEAVEALERALRMRGGNDIALKQWIERERGNAARTLLGTDSH